MASRFILPTQPNRKGDAAVYATVTVMAAAVDSSGSVKGKTVVGTFDSKPITIVSKPSKKRQNSRASQRTFNNGNRHHFTVNGKAMFR